MNKNKISEYDEIPDDNFNDENYCYEIIFNGSAEQHGKAYYSLARIYLKQENYSKADDYLRKAIEFGYNRQLCFEEFDKLATCMINKL